MGNKQSLNPAIPIFHEQEWEEMQTSSAQHPQFGYYRTLKHVETSQLVDEYELAYTDEQDYKFYLNSFMWRLREPEIVKTMYLKEEHRQQFCSRTYIIKVYIQHIETRISDITDIPFPQNLYVALSALDGFHKLYQNLQYFKVEQNQIGVDENGHIRVWINSDFSKDYPNTDQDAHNGDQTTMVNQLIAIVTDNTDKDSEPEPLKDYFHSKGSKFGFEEAKIIIGQYVRKHSVQVPECFESILQIYRKQDGSHQGQQITDQIASDRDHQTIQNQNISQVQRTNNSHYHHQSNQQPNSTIHSQSFQPWYYNNKPTFNPNPNLSPNANSDGQIIAVRADVSYSDNNQKSIPNLHSFQNENMRNYVRSNITQHNANLNQRYLIPNTTPVISISKFGNPLGFQPVYQQDSGLAKIPLVVVPKPRSNIFVHPFRHNFLQRGQNYSPPLVHYKQNQHKLVDIHSKSPPKLQPQTRELLIRRGGNNQFEVIDERQRNQHINMMSLPETQQDRDHAKSSKRSFNQLLDKSQNISVPKQNESLKNLQDFQQKRVHKNQHVAISGALSQSKQNNRSHHIERSRDAITSNSSLAQKNTHIHGREDFIRNPVSSGHYQHDKTYYFTLDTEEELDPEIAADLKKMLSF